MLQRLAYTSHARWLGSVVLALIVAAAPAALAQQEASEPEVVAQQAEPAPKEAQEQEAPAGGTDSVAPPTGIEVIRIKGRPENEINTEVPASVTQFDADTLLALGAQDVSELAKITPNLEIRTAGATAPTFFIRGVGLSDFNANASGAVAVYQDGVALNAPALQLGQLFDVESVEVLRGPQGGGSGRNASAGAIKISSRKPVGDLSSSLNATYGNYNYLDFDGALELPIVEENLSARMAFRLTQRDGWGKNGCGGLPPPGERPPLGKPGYCSQLSGTKTTTIPIPGGLATDVNDLGNWAARGILRYQPEGTDMDWLLIGHGGRTDQLSTLGQAVGTKTYGYGHGYVGDPSVYQDPDITEEFNAIYNGCLAAGGAIPDCTSQANTQVGENVARRLDIRPERGDYDRVGNTRLDTWGASLTGSLPIGPVRLSSISAYDGYDRFRDEDLDFTSRVLFESVTDDAAWQFSQELRADGELEDYPLRWQAGGYYLMQKLSSSTTFFQPAEICPVNEIPCPLPFINRQDLQSYTQDLYSFAFYGGFVWDFLDDFTLEGGVRYNWERGIFDYSRQTGINSPIATPPGSNHDERTWQAPTGTLSLRYRLREDLSVYWKYSHGWKGGQFNASALKVDTQPAGPESIDAWETGLNGTWADGRVALSAALFYYKYYDYQVFVIENNLGAFPQIQVINANEAQVYGAEVEAHLEPLSGLLPYGLDQLLVTARFGWLESEFLDFTNEVVRQQVIRFQPILVVRTIPVTIDYSGNPLINSPRFKVGLSAEWTLPLGRFGSITPRYDGSWSSAVYFDAAKGRGSPNLEGETALPEYAIGQPALFLHNLSLRYTLPIENVQITGWVRNLTDAAYKTYAFDVSQFAKSTINFVGEPRMFGATVSILW